MNFKNEITLSVYLNSAKDDTNRANIERELFQAGIEGERFPQINPKWALSKTRFKSSQDYARALTHRLAIRKAKQKGAPAIFITEDNVSLDPLLLEKLNELSLPDNWGLLKLGTCHKKRPQLVCRGLVQNSESLGTFCYILRAPFYDLAISTLSSRHTHPPSTFDECFDQLEREIPTFSAFPNLAWPNQALRTVPLAENATTFSPFGTQEDHPIAVQGLIGESWGMSKPQDLPDSSSNQFSCPNPRLAVLFLTRDDLKRPEAWLDYLQETSPSPSLYVHAKWPDQILAPQLRDHLIEDHFETAWGEISLVRATLALIKEALQEPTNTHFILASESCIPIKPLSQLYDFLKFDGRSWIEHCRPEDFATTNPMKAARFADSPKIHPEVQFLQSQWMLLNREAAEILVEVDLTHLFEEMFAPDESYFITLLKMAGYPAEQIINDPITWLKWDDENGHPETHEKLTTEIRSRALRSPSFFARKFLR